MFKTYLIMITVLGVPLLVEIEAQYRSEALERAAKRNDPGACAPEILFATI